MFIDNYVHHSLSCLMYNWHCSNNLFHSFIHSPFFTNICHAWTVNPHAYLTQCLGFYLKPLCLVKCRRKVRIANLSYCTTFNAPKFSKSFRTPTRSSLFKSNYTHKIWCIFNDILNISFSLKIKSILCFPKNVDARSMV